MLTILLIATVIRILSKGRDSPFILTDPAKSFKKHIKDPERRKILLEFVGVAKQKFKKYEKRMKAYVNVLNVLTSDPTTSREEFEAIFQAMLAGIYQDQEVRVLFRIKGLNHITEAEFDAIIGDSIAHRNEMHIQNEKKWIQLLDAFDKSLNSMTIVIAQVVKDSERLKSALEALAEYKTAMQSMISHMATCNYRDNKVLSNYYATEEELLKTTNALNINRRKVYDVFVELYVCLGKSLSDKEWTAAAKSMKSLL